MAQGVYRFLRSSRKDHEPATILPQPAITLEALGKEETIMSAAKALLERLGLLAGDEMDHFDLRLARIGRREKRHHGMPILFKNRLTPSAA